MKLIILDNGHGRETLGKRSPIWADGSQLFEYEFNRDIVKRIAEGLKVLRIDFRILVPEIIDISLAERCRRANTYSNAILISIHANAGGGTGLEVFTTPGVTKADPYASIICEEIKKGVPEFPLRSDFSDKDADKEENFYILKNVKHPAILTENLFMDTEKDCLFIMSEEGRKRIAAYHINAIKRFI